MFKIIYTHVRVFSYISSIIKIEHIDRQKLLAITFVMEYKYIDIIIMANNGFKQWLKVFSFESHSISLVISKSQR